MFLSSLKLKAQVVLRSGTHYFRSQAIDDLFDPRAMATEESAPMEPTRIVQIGLFPAWVQMIEPQTMIDDAKEVTIFPATVVLQ